VSKIEAVELGLISVAMGLMLMGSIKIEPRYMFLGLPFALVAAISIQVRRRRASK
jgi:hypothetical protein